LSLVVCPAMALQNCGWWDIKLNIFKAAGSTESRLHTNDRVRLRTND
jgi:hypothetical protein